MSEFIRRRTPGERQAYLQGHLSALRMVATHSGVSEFARHQFAALIELHQKQFDGEIIQAAERRGAGRRGKR